MSKGQTLIEVIVALSVVMLILAAISIAVTASVSNSSFIKNQNLASKYAQEGIEHIRHLYGNQKNFYEDYSAPAVFFMDDDNVISLDGGFDAPNIDGQFVRTVDFDIDTDCDSGFGNNEELKVTVSVYWSSGKCRGEASAQQRYCHKSELVTCFTERTRGLDL